MNINQAIQKAGEINNKMSQKFCPVAQQLCVQNCIARRVARAEESEKVKGDWEVTGSNCLYIAWFVSSSL